ncbi:MAG TPA: hypothetical protein VF950_14675 [Planctomycetota bacterium]
MKYIRRPSSEAPPTSSPAEVQIRIPCAGRKADAVLADLIRGLTEAHVQGRDPLVVLEDLGLLQDSVMTLIKGISRGLVDYPRNVTFWEASGFTEAFLSVMEVAPDDDRGYPKPG